MNRDLIIGIVVSLALHATFLGAFFIATDYVTSPGSASGKLVYGFGVGLLTWIIRSFAGYPEGMAFAVLLMNFATDVVQQVTSLNLEVLGACGGGDSNAADNTAPTPAPTPYADYPNPAASPVTLYPVSGGGAVGALANVQPRSAIRETLIDDVQFSGADLASAAVGLSGRLAEEALRPEIR